jgi:hypothetical protein
MSSYTAPSKAKPYHNGSPVFIMGLPRSGTTWIAKALDSHPNTYYLHEPDISFRPWSTLPEWPQAPYDDALLREAGDYCAALESIVTSRTTGKGPLFAKSYLSLQDTLFRNMAFAAGRATPLPRPSESAAQNIQLVMKSVSNFNRLNLFAKAAPKTKHIVVVRHPLGQVDSMLRGIKNKRFYDTEIKFGWLLRSPCAAELGLDEKTLVESSEGEKLAWLWAINTHAATQNMAESTKLVSHDRLCKEPSLMFSDIFAYVGLEAHPQCVSFLQKSVVKSSSITKSGTYFGVYRDSQKETDKWRHNFTAVEQRRLWDIASRSAIVSMLPDFAEP